MTDFSLAILLDRFVRRMHLGVHAKAQDFDVHRIGPGGAILLLTLAELGEVPIATLTARMLRDKSQMTRGLRPLEQKGLIVRTPSGQDSRVTLVQLTELGHETVRAHQLAVAETLNEILDGLSKTDKQQLEELLARAVG